MLMNVTNSVIITTTYTVYIICEKTCSGFIWVAPLYYKPLSKTSPCNQSAPILSVASAALFSILSLWYLEPLKVTLNFGIRAQMAPGVSTTRLTLSQSTEPNSGKSKLGRQDRASVAQENPVDLIERRRAHRGTVGSTSFFNRAPKYY
jgi:hypothetical protein